MIRLLVAVTIASGSLVTVPVVAQEREVPKDSVLVVLQGCARNRTFIVGPRSEHAAGQLEIEPGRRFRLNGPKKVLDEIKKGEDRMVEVRGLIRRADLAKPGGISLAGGRVRIGGGDPRAPLGGGNVTRDPAYNQIVMDVESSRPLGDSCPAR
jgi:hypothetical protein